MTTVNDLISQLEQLRDQGVSGSTEVVVGSAQHFEPITEVKSGLHEPRQPDGRRVTSIRKVFIS